MIAVDRLTPCKSNARTHSKQQIDQIARSIERFGFIGPVLIDEADQIIAGHGRVEAARRLGLDHVPVLQVRHLSAAERKAYALADNRLAELAGWDREILAIELEALLDLNFDIEVTGFQIDDIDIVRDEVDETASQSTAGKDNDGAFSSGSAVSRAGDLWRLGGHELRCADAGLGGSYAVDPRSAASSASPANRPSLLAAARALPPSPRNGLALPRKLAPRVKRQASGRRRHDQAAN